MREPDLQKERYYSIEIGEEKVVPTFVVIIGFFPDYRVEHFS